jgi:hypothetical protein
MAYVFRYGLAAALAASLALGAAPALAAGKSVDPKVSSIVKGDAASP